MTDSKPRENPKDVLRKFAESLDRLYLAEKRLSKAKVNYATSIVDFGTDDKFYIDGKTIPHLDKEQVKNCIEELMKTYPVDKQNIIADYSTLRWLFL